MLNCKTVLDLGCANNSPLQYFSKKYYSCGLDTFLSYLKESRKKGIHDSYILCDVLNLCIKPKSFDCALALGLIEHLDKEDGLKLIKLMHTIAKKKIIINMPNGFLWQGAMDQNIYQKHKSGWVCDELEKLGFSAFGFFGLKYLRKEYGRLKYRPSLIWFLISELTQFLVFKKPRFAA